MRPTVQYRLVLRTIKEYNRKRYLDYSDKLNSVDELCKGIIDRNYSRAIMGRITSAESYAQAYYRLTSMALWFEDNGYSDLASQCYNNSRKVFSRYMDENKRYGFQVWNYHV